VFVFLFFFFVLLIGSDYVFDVCCSVKQEAGDWGITAENVEKSQHTNFNEDTTNESASVACSNARL